MTGALLLIVNVLWVIICPPGPHPSSRWTRPSWTGTWRELWRVFSSRLILQIFYHRSHRWMASLLQKFILKIWPQHTANKDKDKLSKCLTLIRSKTFDYVCIWSFLKVQSIFIWPVWVLMCVVRWSDRLNDLIHIRHWNGFWPANIYHEPITGWRLYNCPHTCARYYLCVFWCGAWAHRSGRTVCRTRTLGTRMASRAPGSCSACKFGGEYFAENAEEYNETIRKLSSVTHFNSNLKLFSHFCSALLFFDPSIQMYVAK